MTTQYHVMYLGRISDKLSVGLFLYSLLQFIYFAQVHLILVHVHVKEKHQTSLFYNLKIMHMT